MQDTDILAKRGVQRLNRLEEEARPLAERCSDVTTADKARIREGLGRV